MAHPIEYNYRATIVISRDQMPNGRAVRITLEGETDAIPIQRVIEFLQNVASIRLPTAEPPAIAIDTQCL
jgi:hypothetical protein